MAIDKKLLYREFVSEKDIGFYASFTDSGLFLSGPSSENLLPLPD